MGPFITYVLGPVLMSPGCKVPSPPAFAISTKCTNKRNSPREHNPIVRWKCKRMLPSELERTAGTPIPFSLCVVAYNLLMELLHPPTRASSYHSQRPLGAGGLILDLRSTLTAHVFDTSTHET
eukprot:1179547-Prorocentrum_minimum.AAC.2